MRTSPAPPARRPGSSWRVIPWIGAALMLVGPWVAMRYTDEVQWTASDFIIGGALLFGLAALVDQALWRPASLAWRAGALLAVVTGCGLAWGTLAAGLIGDEGHPANLGVAGVLAIAAFGTAFARLEARGMARALTATALAQVLVAGLALALGDSSGAGVSLLFAGAWAVSAMLFRRAAVVAAAKAH